MVDAAKEEGSVNVYNIASDVQNQRMVDAWSDAYPEIDLNITRGAGELPSRVSAELESGNPGADVFEFSNVEWFHEHEDYLADLSELPSMDDWPQDYVAVEDRAVVTGTYPWSMVAWNTNVFPEGFQEWDDLLDPSVQGNLGMTETITVSVAGYLDFLETELGQEFMEELGEQNPSFYAAGIPLMQAVASGEVAVTTLGVPATALELIENGAPIDYTYMEPGFAFEISTAALEDAGNPNAALVFMDWFMSEEGQHAYNGDGYGGSGLDNVEGALPLDDYEMLDPSQYPPAEIAVWEDKFHDYFR